MQKNALGVQDVKFKLKLGFAYEMTHMYYADHKSMPPRPLNAFPRASSSSKKIINFFLSTTHSATDAADMAPPIKKCCITSTNDNHTTLLHGV